MGCDDIREALSALLDGEDPGAVGTALDRHVGGCLTCQGWIKELATLHRRIRIRSAEAIPDLTAAILVRSALQPRGER